MLSTHNRYRTALLTSAVLFLACPSVAAQQTTSSDADAAVQNITNNTLGSPDALSQPIGTVQQSGGQTVVNQTVGGQVGRTSLGRDAPSCPGASFGLGLFGTGVTSQPSKALGGTFTLNVPLPSGSSKACREASKAYAEQAKAKANAERINTQQKALQTVFSTAEQCGKLAKLGIDIYLMPACDHVSLTSNPRLVGKGIPTPTGLQAQDWQPDTGAAALKTDHSGRDRNSVNEADEELGKKAPSDSAQSEGAKKDGQPSSTSSKPNEKESPSPSPPGPSPGGSQSIPTIKNVPIGGKNPSVPVEFQIPKGGEGAPELRFD